MQCCKLSTGGRQLTAGHSEGMMTERASPRTGSSPVTSSHKITPKLYMSALIVLRIPKRTSGAAHTKVPPITCACKHSHQTIWTLNMTVPCSKASHQGALWMWNLHNEPLIGSAFHLLLATACKSCVCWAFMSNTHHLTLPDAQTCISHAVRNSKPHCSRGSISRTGCRLWRNRQDMACSTAQANLIG